MYMYIALIINYAYIHTYMYRPVARGGSGGSKEPPKFLTWEWVWLNLTLLHGFAIDITSSRISIQDQ